MLTGEAAEFGITWTGPPGVERRDTPVGDGSVPSALAWGQDPAELALPHGAGLNAHTWAATAPVQPAAGIAAFAGA